MDSPFLQVPKPQRIPLRHHGVTLASATPAMLDAISATTSGLLHRTVVSGRPGVDLTGPSLTRTLAGLQGVLSATGLAPAAGTEQVDVLLPQTQERIGKVDRQLARILGMEMHSAHLLVLGARGVCLQQRALTKPVDPGLWDTTVGGTRVAGESIDQTLVREMQEEAGVHPDQLSDIRMLGAWSFDLASRYGHFDAWQNEKMWVWTARLADPHWEPHCADGEVMAFDWIPLARLHVEPLAWPLTHELEVLLTSPQWRDFSQTLQAIE